ncbi:PA14 domain-containing protein [Arcticibacterium luteifluviistationis]|uniref:PA14 domain-containing protein n=1 Tax=Arcticibacterium luteifluviistationis TaxID=1784714 RepID=A0A2Z4GDN9_9BACT|nr:PA14 domain-containing protein [Arcticibacterium luteifluviistationis]AWV99274.1 hypothetical protein DJ013_14310 [Arcticibacterium luteifluviistationis]
MKKALCILFLVLTAAFDGQAQCVGQAGQVKWHIWMGFETFRDSSYMSVQEFYPETPDQTIILGSLETAVNFNNYYVSLIRGYISVPQTASYYFNITGDDDSQFYLSTDESRDNLKKKASVYSYTSVGQHDKDSTQTSELTQLVAGQNYYFEIHHYEGSGGDHVGVYWRSPNVPDIDTVWQIVDYNYIKDYNCEVSCPERGTACDDGNATTINDQQDGHCNCVGEYPTANACVGERGKVEAYFYDDIDGTYVENDLTNAPNFPLVPDRREYLDGAFGPHDFYDRNDFGSLVQGYLTVPVTGQYEFNITGDNQTFFFLSKNDSIEYKQTSQALVFYGVGESEHDNSVFQNIGPLLLEAGKYYYYEFRHKENSWRGFFSLHWKTPFQTHDGWKRVPNFYLYDYDCEVSCIAQGTPCDDNNPFTNNDQIDANCECAGVPCTGEDCDNLFAKYNFYDKAEHTTNVISTEENSWLSCGGGTAANPNPARSSLNRWIKYDFSNQYKFANSRIWNYNVAGETTKGFKNVVVDYSVDGITWQALGGTYAWPQAPGDSDYSGFAGPNFNQLKARYILISSIDNWGDATCSGFSKVTFDALLCDNKDTPCDDGDPLTSYDKFDDSCNCRGVDINCASDTIALVRGEITDAEFKAIKRIESQSLVPSTQNVTFTAGNSIVLLPGFEVSSDAVFKADIANCVQTAFEENQELSLKKETLLSDDQDRDNIKKVIFRLNAPGDVKLVLLDGKGNKMVTIIDDYYENLGTQVKYIPTAKLDKGTYVVELSINGNQLKETFVVD